MNEKYTPEVIKKIAENIGCGLVCYLNPETIEIIEIPEAFLEQRLGEDGEDEEEEVYQAELHRIDQEGGNFLCSGPPESFESFKDMELFARNEIQDKPMQVKLFNALSHGKPFRNFKNIVESSDYRQQWFDYHQLCLEKYVREQLSSGEWFEYPEEEDEEL